MTGNTDARRRASAAFQAKREAEGWRKVTIWMHPDTLGELNRLAKVYGTKGEAAAICINHHCEEGRRLEVVRSAREASKPSSEKPAFKSRLKGDWKAP